jgi:nickel/cobalt transporter (NicO) family protein
MMLEASFYLASAFWLGALHAATPGHGKTVAAAYLVGARGRVVDAITLGVVVTLAHTGGIVAFGILGTLSSSAMLPQQVEGYLALATGSLIVMLGLWMLWSQRHDLPWHAHAPTRNDAANSEAHHWSDGGAVALTFGHGTRAHHHHEDSAQGHGHWHGWGGHHHHDHALDLPSGQRPSFGMLLGLGIAGGILPDPVALAVLLAAIANGTLVLGLMTVLVFSVGFASVLVVVGLIAARAGRVVLDRVDRRWTGWLQFATSALVVVVGMVMTANAVGALASYR